MDIGELIASLLGLSDGARGAGQNRGATAADLADPFRGERGQYREPLSEMLLNPKKYQTEKYMESPGYKWELDQGLEAVNRTGNSMFGTTRAGSTALNLVDYAAGAATRDFKDFRDDQTKKEAMFNQQQDAIRDSLLLASGAKTGSPSDAAKAYLGGFRTDKNDIAGGLGGIGDLLGLVGGPLVSMFSKLFGADWSKIFGGGDPTQGDMGITPGGSGIDDDDPTQGDVGIGDGGEGVDDDTPIGDDTPWWEE